MLGPVDWSAPWLAPLRADGEQLMRRLSAGVSLPEALNDSGAAPLRFVAQSELPGDAAYESFVARTGTVPIRDNLHDLFNGLIWRRFPLAKRRLNELQAAQIAGQGEGAARGPVRDAITVFDENGALLQAPPALWDALLAREWRRAFVELRPLWQEAQLLLFGHALLEKLLQPRKEITAHVWCVPCPPGTVEAADSWLAAQLSSGRLAQKPFTPLPVLGVPGWWAGNENFSFYDDSQVFRQPPGKN